MSKKRMSDVQKSAMVWVILLSFFILGCQSQRKAGIDKKKNGKIESKEAKKAKKSDKKLIDSKQVNKQDNPNPKQDLKPILGEWLGVLEINKEMKLRVVMVFKEVKGTFSAVMISPDQGSQEIPIDVFELKGNQIELRVSKLKVRFQGEQKGGVIKGSFEQAGTAFPLELKKQEKTNDYIKVYKQMPKKPYSYLEENIVFTNKKAKIQLAGTLTLPKTEKKHPAILLIAGSGPNDRDETPMKHFLYIADYLTKKGYAVLRFDKRGVGKSKGNYKLATTYDFADDVVAAVDYLKGRKEIDAEKIGLFGHSEGGMIAPIVYNQRQEIKFLILMGAPGVSGEMVLLQQSEDISKASGTKESDIKTTLETNKKIYELIKQEKDKNVLKKKVLALAPSLDKMTLDLTLSPWFATFIGFEPKIHLEKVKAPVLVLSGKKDLQVAYQANNQAIKEALELAGNKDYKIINFENLNHLFQKAKTGLPSEYAQLDEIMSEEVLIKTEAWLKNVIK